MEAALLLVVRVDGIAMFSSKFEIATFKNAMVLSLILGSSAKKWSLPNAIIVRLFGARISDNNANPSFGPSEIKNGYLSLEYLLSCPDKERPK
ncbi:MAG: hypothetical protein GY712_05580 [Oceanicoccus sp.]|uniref:hypothetical protein n=1 Tax=Oceanicoccus sp. TaxID=2691044 RepID=UPI00262300DE|nr:hypothetical protein [Oceanicoccus sp.]MCP3907472.1 hypothetical protein [Oceanicoccus sp.]